MALYLSGDEIADRISDLEGMLRDLRAQRLKIDAYAEGMESEGQNASTIQTAINALLVDWGAFRDQIVTELSAIPLFHQARVKIGMGSLYNWAKIEANFANNLKADLSTAAVIRPNPSSEITYGPGPLNTFLANDYVLISNAEDPENNRRMQVRYTPGLGGVDLIVNGGFATDTIWTKGVGWTITGGVANATTLSTTISQTKANMISAGVAGTPSVGWVNGVYYIVEFTLPTSSAGTLSVGTATTADQHTVTEAGTHRALILSDGGAAGLVFTGAGWTGTIDNVSLIPFSGLAFLDELGADNDEDTQLVITLQER